VKGKLFPLFHFPLVFSCKSGCLKDLFTKGRSPRPKLFNSNLEEQILNPKPIDASRLYLLAVGWIPYSKEHLLTTPFSHTKERYLRLLRLTLQSNTNQHLP